MEITCKRVRTCRRFWLAGRSLHVNARAVYFVAAAQVGMDERGRDVAEGRRGAGHGHYVPVGGFAAYLATLRQVLEMLGSEPPVRRGLRVQPEGAETVRGGGAIVEAIVHELARMLQALQAQADGQDIPGYRHDEHREPSLRAYLLQRGPSITAVAVPHGDADAGAAARRLFDAIGSLDGIHPHHFTGSYDPHGSDHALGRAIDFNYGYAPNNLAPGAAEYWTFIRYVIQRYGLEADWSEVDLQGTEQPTAQNSLPPRTMRAIATLLERHGREALQELQGNHSGPGAPSTSGTSARSHRRTEAYELDLEARMQARVRRGLQDRLRALESMRTSPDRPATLQADIERECAGLSRDIAATGAPGRNAFNLSPDDLRHIVNRHVHDLGALVESSNSLLPASPKLGDPSLFTVNFELDELDAPADSLPASAGHAAENARRAAALRATRKDGFMAWFRAVTDGNHPLYDQPDAMVEGVESVNNLPEPNRRDQHDNRLQGGHHWMVIAPEVTRSDVVYRDELIRDMRRRSTTQIERVLCVMAESPIGRDMLFRARDPIFTDVLQEVLADPAHQAYGEDANTMLGRVNERVVAPYAGGDIGDQVRRQLRHIGIYVSPSAGVQ